MECLATRVEEATRRKVFLLRSLLDCLSLEKENLIHLDVKGLWSSMEEKHRLLASIQETDKEISKCNVEISDEGKSAHPMLKDFGREIRRLKQEIGVRVRENVSFIEETLLFFDEIISVFASGAKEQCSYESIVKKQKTSSNLIFESEV